MPLWAAVWDLTTIPNPLNPEESLGALFIDPNADPDDPLPGGLLLKMQVSDVQASHVYENLSTENNVITSAMRITLDPFSAMLTIVPTAANYANVTIWGIDREHNKISATMMVTVVSGVGTVRFDANHLPNGAYVYRLVATDKTITRTMVLLK